MRIYYSYHGAIRLSQRADRFSIELSDARQRVVQTIACGRRCRKHVPYGCIARKLYFNDNISFCVIFRKKGNVVKVITVIIEEGR